MARLVLHIGTHKTATTTIQDMFAHNADLLAQHGLIYPRLGRFSGHHGLVMDWNRLHPAYALPGGSRAALQSLVAAHAGAEGTVFLSSEEFSRGRPGGRVDFAELRALLAPFDEIAVICVLREQWQFIQSVYLEIAKSKPPPKPPALVETAIAESHVDGLWTDYNLLYDHLLTAFAPEEITFLDFAAMRAHPGGVVGAMLETLGTGLAAGALEPVNGGLSNPSPPALPAWAAALIAEPKVAPPWLVAAAVEAFRIEFGLEAASCLFSRAEYRQLDAHFAAANARLAARHAAVQPGFAIGRTPLPEEADTRLVFRNAIGGKFWHRCTRTLFRATEPAMRS